MTDPHVLAVHFARPIDDDLAADVEKQSAFVGGGVRALRVDPGRTWARVVLEAGSDPEVAQARAARFVEMLAGRFRRVPKKTIAERTRTDDGPIEEDAFAALVSRGWVIDLGFGQAGLRGPALRLLDAVDRRARELGASTFGGVEERYPALVPTDVLAQCGHFGSFPQHVNMVMHLLEDYETIDRFREANDGAPGFVAPEAGSLGPPKVCLSPAVCYHTYRARAGTRLEADVDVATCVGRCFRYEAGNMRGLDRLWDFTMREIVLVGTEGAVSDRRALGQRHLFEMAEALDLSVTLESANDPFFASAYAKKTYYQARSDLKFELRAVSGVGPPGAEPTLAIASANLHESFFGTTFGITASDGQPAFTGCLAWGLERWIVAAFAQHGFDPARWPEAWRREVFG